MPDTVNVGDPAAWGVRVWRHTTTEPVRKVPINPTALGLVVTAPDGTTTTYAIGAFRTPETGRYELDRTHTQVGTWKGAYTITLSYTDEDGNSRSATIYRNKEITVLPLATT